MHPIVLCDSELRHTNLLPLSFTRPIADFRVGIDTIAEKWRAAFGADAHYYAVSGYLARKYRLHPDAGCPAYFIASHLLPDADLVSAIKALPEGEALVSGDTFVAMHGTLKQFTDGDYVSRQWDASLCAIDYVFDIFLRNGQAIREDFARITAGRKSQQLSASNILIGDAVDADGCPMLFIEEGASIEGAILNVTHGPIYIGKDAEVMEGACLRGPLAICRHAHVNMGARIYPDTTIGPYCKVGGEVNNVVMFAYSNKAHDGFLGNAVIGEWCNIGAGVNASNLKNDYSKIRVWNYASQSFMRTDLQFCGLIMGDHSKIGINVMLNTATVMGVGVNLHGSGFPRTFIPGFSEGSPAAGFSEVTVRKFNDIATRVMSRRGLDLTEEEKCILESVRQESAKFRH